MPLPADTDVSSPKYLRDKYAIVGVGETTYTRGMNMVIENVRQLRHAAMHVAPHCRARRTCAFACASRRRRCPKKQLRVDAVDVQHQAREIGPVRLQHDVAHPFVLQCCGECPLCANLV